MKYVITFMLAVLVAAGAALYYVKARSLQVRNQELVAQKAAAEEKARVLEKEKTQAEQQGQKLIALADELGERLSTRSVAESNKIAQAVVASAAAGAEGEASTGTNKGGGFGKMLSNMMSDPDTRNFIKEQQRMMMGQLYSPLVKKMNMSDEEAARFNEVLLDNMMKGAEKATAMFGGSSVDRQEMAKTMAEEQKRFDEEVRSLLGESRYQQYKDYSLTMQERAQFAAFRQMDPSGAAAFNEEQTEQLLTMMAEEKKNATTSMGTGGTQEALAMDAMASEDGLKKLLELQEGINGRVYERAAAMLDTSQLNSFGRFQSNQLQQLRFGMGMARKMFQQ